MVPHLTLNLTASKGKGKKNHQTPGCPGGILEEIPASYAEIQELCLKYEGNAKGTLPPVPK